MPVLHHVFVELNIGGKWIHADPTYNFNTLGRAREEYTERVVI
jgi:transglutaminase-like putative cysteine protease